MPDMERRYITGRRLWKGRDFEASWCSAMLWGSRIQSLKVSVSASGIGSEHFRKLRRSAQQPAHKKSAAATHTVQAKRTLVSTRREGEGEGEGE